MTMRGDIHYIMEGKSTTGSEQDAGRPAVIVSNDVGNAHSPVVEVVFLTTRPKNDLPTHVTIRSAKRISIALCEQITSVSTERLGEYAGTCTEQEMELIDQALRISLALEDKTLAKHNPPQSEVVKLAEDLRIRLRSAEAERDMYKNMYDTLIGNILDRRS